MDMFLKCFRCRCCRILRLNDINDNDAHWLAKLSSLFAAIRWKSCAKKCTKLFLIVVNFFFLGLGILMLASGACTYLEMGAYGKYMAGVPVLGAVVDFERIPALLVIVGGAVSVLSFLGCCGACSDSVCFLSLYAILLFTALVLQVCLSISVIVYQNTLLLSLESSLQRQLTYEYNSSATSHNETNKRVAMVTRAWDTLQIKFKCCGAKGPHDFQASLWRNRTSSFLVPLSCCVLSPPDKLAEKPTKQKDKDLPFFDLVRKNGYSREHSGSHDSKEAWIDEVDYLPFLVNEDQCQIQAALNLGSPPLKPETDFTRNGDFLRASNNPHEAPPHHHYFYRHHRRRRHHAALLERNFQIKRVLKLSRETKDSEPSREMLYEGVSRKNNSIVHAGVYNALSAGTGKMVSKKHIVAAKSHRKKRFHYGQNGFLHQASLTHTISWAVHLKGCQGAIMEWLRPKVSLLVLVTITTAVFQVLHFFFACILLSSLKKNHTDPPWFEEDSR